MMSSDLDYGAERWPSDDWWVRLLEDEDEDPDVLLSPKT